MLVPLTKVRSPELSMVNPSLTLKPKVEEAMPVISKSSVKVNKPGALSQVRFSSLVSK